MRRGEQSNNDNVCDIFSVFIFIFIFYFYFSYVLLCATVMKCLRCSTGWLTFLCRLTENCDVYCFWIDVGLYMRMTGMHSV